ncbi:YcxB family protein [Streptomyces sp. NBC_00234]|uniref:YcxB family protein n=1 Tax=Streptomyces sp. NBC_00234 TaxID=2903638 RepID=UPI002E28A438|nr:YcxB family protein [Streptomyces sp. NBC_00234]
MTERSRVAAGAVVELRYALGKPDWSDTFRARGRVRGVKGRLQGLLLPVLFAVMVWLLAESAPAAGMAFLGSMLGLVVRTGVLAARHARMSAPLGPWTVTVADSDDGVRFMGTDMETHRGWRSLGGYVETAAGFVLLTPRPYLLVVHYLPKRAMGRDDTDRLRGILERHLPRYGGRPPRH